jgi:hypothetical protein
MNIIRPNSSYPGIHDGLNMYSGVSDASLSTATSRTNGIIIKTELRQLFFANFTAIPEVDLPIVRDPLTYDFSTIPVYTNAVNNLGYTVSKEPNRGTLNIAIVVPLGYRLQYHIVGSQLLAPITHSEIFSATLAASTYSEAKEARFIIANAGTTGVTAINNTGKTFTFSHPSAGVYKVTSSSALFNVDKVVPFITLEGPSLLVYEAGAKVNSSTEIEINIRGWDGSTLDDVDPAYRIFLNLTILP